MAYTIRLSPDVASWQAAMRGVRARARDLTPAMKDAGQYMLLEIDDRFQAEVDPQGHPWKPLSPGWIRQKGFDTILQWKGRRGGLIDSITTRARPTYLDHGTNKVYGAIHQLGGKAGRRHTTTIPARPYLGYNDENIAHIKALVVDHIKGNE